MAEFTRIDRAVLQRYESNPILSAKDFRAQLGIRVRSVYNCSAVKTASDAYVMLCRVNQLNHKTLLWGADSEDGINWKLRKEPFAMPEDAHWKSAAASVYYDPRITWMGDRYLVLLACQGNTGSVVALFESENLDALTFVNYICAPVNRNMVIFPELGIDGRYMRLERPAQTSDGKGNIWLSHSPDLIHWGDWKEIIRTTDLWNYAFSGLGPSTVPLRTDRGWLILFHAIMNNCTTREYSIGAALLDLERPWVVRHVTEHPVLAPEAEYELRGLVDHVCFPCSKILEPDGNLKVYYGGADTVQCLATGKLEDIIYACENW